MSSQTLQNQKRRVHHNIIFEKGINLDANYIVVLEVKPVINNYCQAYVAIDYSDYKLMDQVFFDSKHFTKNSDIKNRTNPYCVCGYISVENVLSEIPVIKKSYDNLYKDLTDEERLELHMIYKIRVIKMEREQNTNVIETVILDTCEFKKHNNWKFNPKTFFSGMVKRFKEPGITKEKLYSGLQKRRAQKRWAKVEFLKRRGISIN